MSVLSQVSYFIRILAWKFNLVLNLVLDLGIESSTFKLLLPNCDIKNTHVMTVNDFKKLNLSE